MKIWIDLANSPQVLFFRPILRELQNAGHSLAITARAYAQTAALADQLGLSYELIGRHGGRSLPGLMTGNFLRAVRLARGARCKGFDLAVSHNSYSQAVAARWLGIPFVTLMDYEHQPLNHLCFRLARRVIVPEVFPAEYLRKFGASHKVQVYPGLKEQIYLADFAPQEDFRRRQGLPTARPLIVVRPPAPWTAYQRFENDLFDELLLHLSTQDQAHILFLPRLPEQAESVRRMPGVQVADSVYDGPNLLYHADAVVSGGGTMNREAAVLGTPAYTVFKGRLGAVDRWLIQQKRLILLQSPTDFGGLFPAAGRRLPRLAQSALLERVVALILGGV
jgi:hypothetical protein